MRCDLRRPSFVKSAGVTRSRGSAVVQHHRIACVNASHRNRCRRTAVCSNQQYKQAAEENDPLHSGFLPRAGHQAPPAQRGALHAPFGVLSISPLSTSIIFMMNTKRTTRTRKKNAVAGRSLHSKGKDLRTANFAAFLLPRPDVRNSYGPDLRHSRELLRFRLVPLHYAKCRAFLERRRGDR
jgi:hypothetical protein